MQSRVQSDITCTSYKVFLARNGFTSMFLLARFEWVTSSTIVLDHPWQVDNYVGDLVTLLYGKFDIAKTPCLKNMDLIRCFYIIKP